MKILQHTDDHQPTSMGDVYDALIGQKVSIYTVAGEIIGTLNDYNGYICEVGGLWRTVFVPISQIVAIAEDNS